MFAPLREIVKSSIGKKYDLVREMNDRSLTLLRPIFFLVLKNIISRDGKILYHRDQKYLEMTDVPIRAPKRPKKRDFDFKMAIYP